MVRFRNRKGNRCMETKSKRYNNLMTEMERAYHDAAQRMGISDSEMVVLYMVCINGDACLLSDITELSGVSKQTINSALRKLEKQAVIYLELVDSRKKRVCLTEYGKFMVEQKIRKLIRIEDEIFDSWKKEEWETYMLLTQRHLANLRERFKEL